MLRSCMLRLNHSFAVVSHIRTTSSSIHLLVHRSTPIHHPISILFNINTDPFTKHYYTKTTTGTKNNNNVVNTADIRHSMHHLPTIADIIQYMKQDRIILAYRSFINLESSNSYFLADLPPKVFFNLIQALLNNKSQVLKSKSHYTKLHRVATMFELMQTVEAKTDINVLTLMIYIYAKMNNLPSALKAYAEIKQHGFDHMCPLVLGNMTQAHILNDDEKTGLEYFELLKQVDSTIYPYEVLLGSYVLKCDESGIARVIEMMRLAGFSWTPQILTKITNYYASCKDDLTVLKLIKKFQNEGGDLNARIYHRLMVTNNNIGEHHDALQTLNQAIKKRVRITHPMITEKAVAYAGLGQEKHMWDTYCAVTNHQFVQSRLCIAMAKHLGPLLESERDVIGAISAYVKESNGSLTNALSGLVNGYKFLGDPDSAKYLISVLTSYNPSLSLAIHVKVVYAYLETGNFDGALGHVKYLEDRYQSAEVIHIYPLLVHAISYRPEMVKKLLAWMARKGKDIDIDQEYQRAAFRAKLGPKTFDDYNSIGQE
ncbi:hypothetical protein BDV3_004268 [Batrachochytrium dendrobatidis]